MPNPSHGIYFTCLATPAIVLLLGSVSTVRADPLPAGDEMRESVVRIVVETDKGHVVGDAKTINVGFLAAGKPTLVPAHLIAADPTKDIAIIEADADIFGEPVVLANYDTNPPAKVTAIGYPGAADEVAGNPVPAVLLEPSYSVGAIARIVSNVKDMGDDRLIQHTATINPGNSGGPLFDECGRVIGINTLRIVPNQDNEFAQGIFYSVDIRELLPMLEENLIQARFTDKPCTAGTDLHDIAPVKDKETEAALFDRFAACVSARPCDGNICKSRYLKRVASELASTRQADVDLRMAASGPLCTQQKETDAYAEFLSCANAQPCDFEKSCAPQLEKSLRPEIMKKRQTLVDRVRGKAQDECREASAPGIWHAGQTNPGVWAAKVSNEGGAALIVTCVVDGDSSGNGVFELDDVKGNRARWTGTRSVQMTIDTNTEPLSLDLTIVDGELVAATKHEESGETRGWLKELLGKLTVGGVVTFQEAQIALDETFSLNGASDALEPCLKARYAAQKAEGQERQAQ